MTNYTQEEVLPSFKGGRESVAYYLSNSLRYPKMAENNCTEGRVTVRFIVDGDGSIVEGKVISGIGDGCDGEALRVLMNAPRWNPGIQKGLPVRVVYASNIFQINKG